jgi:ABC-type uncharacterized transport system substrate-binding protein
VTRLAALLLLVGLPLLAGCQPAARVARVGTLALGGRERGIESQRPARVRKGLRELGWIEGRNLVIEARFAEGQRERLPGLVAELAGLPVDVIVGFGTAASDAARRATARIPVVMAAASDPLSSGLITSLARPGGNVTGLSLQQGDLLPKWLALLKEAVPTVSRVTVIMGQGTSEQGFRNMMAAAPRLGATLRQTFVNRAEDLDAAFAPADGARPDGVVIQPTPTIDELRARIATIQQSILVRADEVIQ